VKRVLILDDDKDIRQTVAEALRDEGYDAVEAESGELALHEVARAGADLVLTDMMMPGMDGPHFFACSANAATAKGSRSSS
jgi:CheY-like chemotaxis protein